MTRRSLLLAPAVATTFSACKPPEGSRVSAIIGAILIDGTGGPPVSNSVIVIAASRITATGSRTSLIAPQGDKIDARGKFIVPALIDVNAADLPRVGTLAEAKRQVAEGFNALIGMISDTEDIDPVFLRQLRDLRIILAPQLSLMEAGAEAERARRNTKRLASAGVQIALSSGNHNTYAETEALAAAGLDPMQVVIAATRNGAQARKKLEDVGTLEPGKEATLMVLAANPLEDVRNLRKVERTMVRGEWVSG